MERRKESREMCTYAGSIIHGVLNRFVRLKPRSAGIERGGQDGQREKTATGGGGFG